MIVDSSAVMAILLGELEEEAFLTKFDSAIWRRISAGTWLEINVVISRRGDERLLGALDVLMANFPLEIVAATSEQARIGAEAYRKFGQRSGSPANLNFGDCFSYALAKATGEPLLFKGNDFIHTDIAAA